MMTDKPYIQIKGVGRIRKTPDTIIISMKVEALDRIYKSAVDSAEEQLQNVREGLANIGFKKEDLKTRDFKIDSSYNERRNVDGDYERTFAGYKVKHSLSLAFPLDMKRLDEVISALSMSLANPGISISFALADVEGAKKEILESATKDAKEKAEILCNASNVKLGRLMSIDYSWNEICFESDDKFMMNEYGSAGSCFDFEPDDITASDTVEFTWAIE